MCFAQAVAIGEALGTLKPIGEFIGQEISASRKRAAELDAAKHEATVAKYRAQAELAAFQAKSELEWDLKWADAATSSWKDELLLIVWLIPTIGLFIPGLREGVEEGFDYLSKFSPDAPQLFMAGWAVIFAATFGLKQALQFMLPGRVANLVGAMNAATPDIPMDKAVAAQRAVSAKK